MNHSEIISKAERLFEDKQKLKNILFIPRKFIEGRLVRDRESLSDEDIKNAQSLLDQYGVNYKDDLFRFDKLKTDYSYSLAIDLIHYYKEQMTREVYPWLKGNNNER